MIRIGKDIILKRTIIADKKRYYFETQKEAIDYYCQYLCNPIYNEAHYDCECCPITLAKELTHAETKKSNN